MCKVSVIIPVYNVEKYLPACLDSVQNQTLRDLEVICIDDCSPDRCGEILDEYAARDSRISVIHLEENHRQGFGRNLGMDKAVGDYLYFLDSDDMIEPETLEELTRLADGDMLDAVFFDSRSVFESEDLKKIYVPSLPMRKGNYSDGVYEGKNLLDAFIRQNEWTCYPQRIFWRREFLLKEGIRYPEYCEHEDEFFAFAGILAADRARYVRKPYFTLRVRANSVMTSEPAPKNFHGYLMNFYWMNDFIMKRGIHTYGAEIIIARIMECVMTLYAKLKDRFDLGEPFIREPDKTIYTIFSSLIRLEYSENGFYAMDSEVVEEIRKYRVAYIYGVGLTGQRVCRKLERNGFLIGGFLTKNSEESQPVLMGRTVQKLDDADLPEDAVVVAAVKMMFWEETRAIFAERNIPCVFHRKL